MYSFISPIGGPNISVRLAYFHPNRLLIELYKQETEIRCKKDDGPCSARDWDGKDYLRIIPRVVW